MIGQRKPGRSNSDYHEGVTLSLESTGTYSTLFPPNKYLTFFTIVHLCGSSLLKT